MQQKLSDKESKEKNISVTSFNTHGVYRFQELYSLRRHCDLSVCFLLQRLEQCVDFVAVFRCGEEEEPCMWVRHTAGGFGGGFTSKAGSE